MNRPGDDTPLNSTNVKTIMIIVSRVVKNTTRDPYIQDLYEILYIHPHLNDRVYRTYIS